MCLIVIVWNTLAHTICFSASDSPVINWGECTDDRTNGTILFCWFAFLFQMVPLFSAFTLWFNINKTKISLLVLVGGKSHLHPKEKEPWLVLSLRLLFVTMPEALCCICTKNKCQSLNLQSSGACFRCRCLALFWKTPKTFVGGCRQSN